MDDAIRAWIDGDLDAAGDAHLQQRLRDPGVAREFLRAVHFDLALRTVARARLARQEIEPGSDRSSRHGTTARLRGRRPADRTRPMVMAALLALAVGAALVAWLRPPAVARLVVGAGSVAVAGDALAAGGERGIAAGTELIAAASAAALLLYADGTTIALAGGSRLTIGDDATGKTIRLDEGDLRADVQPQPAGRPLAITTPRARTTVLGTRLAVSGGTREHVAVEAGRVQVVRRSDGSAVEVAAGEHVDIPALGPLAVIRPPPPGPGDQPPPNAGLRLWLSADLGVVADADGLVGGWRDQSGNGMDFLANHAEARPRQLAAVLGRRAAVSFDARDDAMVCRQQWPGMASFTVVVALRPTAFGQWTQGLGSGWGRFQFHGGPDGALFAGVGLPLGGGDAERFTSDDLPAGTLRREAWQWCLVSYDQASRRGEFHRDGTLVLAKPMPAPLPWRYFAIGRRDPVPHEPFSFGGDLHELLVYDRVLSASERAQLDRRLRARLELAP